MQPKVILHFISNSKTGGGQVHLLDILKHLDKQKFKQIVICDREGYYVPLFEQHAERCYCVDFKGNYGKLFHDVQTILKVEQPDVLHNHFVKASIVGTLAAWRSLPHAQKFNALHEEISDTVTQKKVMIWLYQAVIAALQIFGVSYIAVSRYAFRGLVAQCIQPHRIHTIYNSVQGRFLEEKKEEKKKEKNFEVLTVARLDPQKGLETVLAVAQKLPEIKFTIVGDGALEAELKEKIKKENLKNVDLTGFQGDVLPFLKQADLFFLPSRWEVFGIAVAEAMAVGLPVLATKVGGIPELVVEGKGGFLCNTVEEFVEKVQFLQQNPTTAAAFGAFNRQRTRALFSVEKMIERLEILYEKK